MPAPNKYKKGIINGKIAYQTFKCWHKDRGYRSFATRKEAEDYRDTSKNVARIDNLLTIIEWTEQDDYK